MMIQTDNLLTTPHTSTPIMAAPAGSARLRRLYTKRDDARPAAVAATFQPPGELNLPLIDLLLVPPFSLLEALPFHYHIAKSCCC